MKTRVLPVAGLLFLSGMCALVFQVVWFREFRLVFGASTAASAAVMAVFMGGLGLGNLVLGRRVDRAANPLLWYAALEMSVALSTAASPLLVDLVRRGYVGLGGQLSLGFTAATALRLLLAVLVLGLPTFLMGGTLAAAARAVTPAYDEHRRDTAVLYALNTLGAVAGALLSTFLVIELLGNRQTLWLACAVNGLTALAALALARLGMRPATGTGSAALEAAPAAPAPPAHANRPSPAQRRKMQRAQRSGRLPAAASAAAQAAAAQTAAAGREPPAAVIYAAAGVVGFAFFVMELVWYRMLGPILGGSTFTFGMILAVALAGIGMGGAVYPLLFARLRPTLRWFALTCGLEALAMAAPFALGDRVALWTVHLQQAHLADSLNTTLHGLGVLSRLSVPPFGGEVLQWLLMAALVILPAAVVSGVQFPLLIALLGRGDAQLGRQIGSAVAWNTVGDIAGSLLGGFGLLPLLSAPGAWRAVVGLLVVLSLLLVWVAGRVEGRRPAASLLPVAAAAAALLCIALQGPTAVWRHSGVGVGRAKVPTEGTNALRTWENAERQSIVWQTDGVESSIAILCGKSGLAFFNNGKSDGSAVGDAGTQIMLGLVAGVLHPNPQNIFVVGLGTGETAGWLAAMPSTRRVDVVELEPAVDEMARRCASINHDVMRHPKVNRIYNDAREVLLTTPQHYDLIVSEPSNPYRNGVACLFTTEYYRAGRERLNPGGLFAQWIQAYEVDAATLRTIMATLRSVYPHVEVWQSTPADLLLLAGMQPVVYPVSELRRRIAQEPFRSALRIGWRAEDLEGFLARYLGGPEFVTQFIGQQATRVNSDDRNDVEYGCARTLGHHADSASQGATRITQDMRILARTCGSSRPPTEGGVVDWSGVGRQWCGMYAESKSGVPHEPALAADEDLRRQAMARLVNEQWREGLACWMAQPEEPCCPTEQAWLALGYAHLGDDRARPLIDALSFFEPTEAQALRGILLFNQKRLPESARALGEAFCLARGDPWTLPYIFSDALDCSMFVGRTDPRLAAELYLALQKPFALSCLDVSRRHIACWLAAHCQPVAAAEMIESFEPNIIWTRGFLELRCKVYTATKRPLAAAAARDLEEFDGRTAQQPAGE